ncbi:MAG TPA: RsmG family class I SAM-dependent methyltransferase, partial [Candidatus Polarisedimenticolia bacterium]|nr:RsmG family class I SAM-dependent methyltransferase [Candidatus Polarisedimenticolia bacterium]
MVPRPRRPEHRPDHFHSALLAAAASIDRPLSDREAGALTTHFRLLGEWSRRMNLTGLKDEESILRRHFLEPIAAADLLENGGRLIDLGSGNGFPAI